MSNNKHAANIYVELDCILDTRLAVLKSIVPEHDDHGGVTIGDIIDQGYHTRRADHWEGIDMVEVKRRYDERNLYTLSQATVTGCVAMLNKIAFELAVDLPESPTHSKVNIYVNTYPYELEPDELTGIEVCLNQWISAPVEYKFIRKAPEEITAAIVYQMFYVMVMYDFSSWLNIHVDEFSKVPIHEVTLIAPRVNPNQAPPEELLRELKEVQPLEGVDDEFDLYEKLAMPFVNLMLVDPVYFSMLRPDFPILYEKEPFIRSMSNDRREETPVPSTEANVEDKLEA